jgi:hypothetical protein
MASSKLPKDLRALAKRYLAKGWTLKAAGSGHAKWLDPTGRCVTTTSQTPSNAWRVAKETAAILNRYEMAAA